VKINLKMRLYMDYLSNAIQQIKVYEKTVSAREAMYADYPGEMLPEIKDLLSHLGIKRLYSHQAEIFESALRGLNIVIATSTASGKTLGFLLPVLQEILRSPSTRAIFVYPTKALASDQHRAMQPMVDYFGLNRLVIGVYDGDTPPNERSRIRNSANIILTNPEMLNASFLPHHSKNGFNFLLSNLKYVVIDELHTYRGAFGSHLANVFRRLNRLCKYYSSSPQFLCSSATIANPVELAENICSKRFNLTSNDGSPAPQRNYIFLQPPMIGKSGIRKSVSSVAAELVPELVVGNRNFIAFCKSRKAVEVVLKESRDKLKTETGERDLSGKLEGYRGGYTPLERKKIESEMISGILNGLVSTNALELGIDIGKVDTTVLTGYPGTRASFWQQSGRAGRSGHASDTFLILDNLPFDQYLAIEPDWLFESSSENAIIDKNNLFIQIAHLRAAAAELPLTMDDAPSFPDMGEIIPILIENKELKRESGKYAWTGPDFPSGDYSLRNMDKARYKLINNSSKSLIAEMDETQAFREIHKGAIYMHSGQTHEVLSLDFHSKTAVAKPVDVNFYTEPFVNASIDVILEHKSKSMGRTTSHFGDIKVYSHVSGYKKLQFHNHQNLGFEEFEEPLVKSFETEGAWIDIPDNVSDMFKKLALSNSMSRDSWKGYLGAMGYALLNAAMMTTMTTKEDISSSSLKVAASICIYDLFTGGLGFSEKAYGIIDEIVEAALKMVNGCKCKDGCPACIGDYTLNKAIVLWGLVNLLEKTDPPDDLKLPQSPEKILLKKAFSFDSIIENWAAFTEFIKNSGEYLSSFISSIHDARTEGSTLIMLLSKEFYKSWITDAENLQIVTNMLTNYIEVPIDFKIAFDVLQDRNESWGKEAKISKRHNDLTRRR
jgi:DEAD/DEAH box helicase domain-containing protein